ncbi:MAG: hypothetical protein WD317_07945 [Balneolaceae bacterium]
MKDKSAKKRILKISGLVAGILVVLIAGLTLSLDHIVKSTVESTGSDMLGTNLSVDNVTISLFSGNGHIEGVAITNPPDFGGGDAMVIRDIRIEMNPFTVLSDTVVIDRIEVLYLDVSYELNTRGSNLGQLIRNMETYSEESEESFEAVMVVDHFLMDETSLTVRSDITEIEPVTVTLPRIEQTGIGRDEDAAIDAVMKVILEMILNRISEEGLDRLTEEGGRRFRKEAEDAVKDLLND